MEELKRQFEILEKEHEDLISVVNALSARLRELEDKVNGNTSSALKFEEK